MLKLSIYLSIPFIIHGFGKDFEHPTQTEFLQPHGLPALHMVIPMMEIRRHGDKALCTWEPRSYGAISSAKEWRDQTIFPDIRRFKRPKTAQWNSDIIQAARHLRKEKGNSVSNHCIHQSRTPPCKRGNRNYQFLRLFHCAASSSYMKTITSQYCNIIWQHKIDAE